ncbi:MAG: hypothetical protein P4L31_08515, partial [Candidatus Babeliales bacterium]|nr:hypothetical protein [Candidatus Babeliales bacterium]
IILFSKAHITKLLDTSNKPVVAKAMTGNPRNQTFKNLLVNNPSVMAQQIVACKSEDWNNITLQ